MSNTPPLSPDSIVGPAYGRPYTGRSARKAARLAQLHAYEASKHHDADCERQPGGRYHGLTAGGQMIPCHCPARRQGEAEAAR